MHPLFHSSDLVEEFGFRDEPLPDQDLNQGVDLHGVGDHEFLNADYLLVLFFYAVTCGSKLSRTRRMVGSAIIAA